MALFFGYGANRNRSKLNQVLGHDPGEGIGAIVSGFTLCYQNLNQIPQKAAEVLSDVYGYDFKAYTLKEGEGLVSGIVYELNDQDLSVIKEWEFVGLWREMVQIKVKTANGYMLDAFTEKAVEGSEIAAVVDGLLYSEFVQPSKEKINPAQTLFYTQQQVQIIRDWLQKQQ